MSQPRIILAGGSGFIGQALACELRRRDYAVTILTRSPRTRTDGIAEIQWDGRNPGEWVKALDGAEAVVNLAGQNINCPHTPENLATITSSRVDSVRALAAALPRLTQPPRTWVQASAVGYYGDTGDRVCDETSPAGACKLAEVCRQWEDALGSVPASGAVFRAPAENPKRTEYSPDGWCCASASGWAARVARCPYSAKSPSCSWAARWAADANTSVGFISPTSSGCWWRPSPKI